jgi:hypothetical protein
MLSAASLSRLSAEVAVSGTQPYSAWTAIQNTANTMGAQGSVATIVPAAGTQFTAAARTLQDRVYYLGLDYLLSTTPTTKANCLNQIYAELQSAANWGHSATDNTTSPGNWNQWEFLDVPEITHAYAIAYDWCYAGWSSAQKTFILNTIVSNGFGPGLSLYGPPTSSHLNGSDNWPIVCNSGLILGALAIIGDEPASPAPKAPTILDDLMPTLFNCPAISEFSSDGGWPESEDYWNFATRYLSTLFCSLETSSATCYNLDKLPGMSSTGSFELYEIGPLKKLFDFGDEGGDGFWLETQGTACALQYFGLKYNQPVYSWRQQQDETPYPTDLVWYDPRGATATPSSLNLPTSTYYGNAGIILLRSAWNNTNALFAGLKAGPNPSAAPPYGNGHEDLELGSFVFDALGIRWVADLGEESYSVNGYWNDTWSPTTTNRWDYYRCRAEGNNTLVINPANNLDQSLSGYATITNFESNANTQQAIIDMSTAYPSVTSAKRGLRFINGTAQLQDEVNSSTAIDLNWFMHLGNLDNPISYSLNTAKTIATLTSGTKCLQVQIQSPSTAIFTTMNAVPLSTSPNPSGQNPNTGVTKLRIELPSSTATTLTVALCPYVSGNTPPTPPAVSALSSW